MFYPKPLPFLSDFFFTAYWIQEKQNQQEEKADNNDMGEKQDPKIRNADNYLLATIDPVLKVVMDEFQYLFVLKVLDGIARLFNELVSDQRCSNASDATKRTACMTLFVPVVNVSLLLSGKTPQQNEPSDLVASENSQISGISLLKSLIDCLSSLFYSWCLFPSDEFATGCLMTNPFTSVEENLALGQTGEMIESFPEFLLKSDECKINIDDSD